jgi:hypothetical protein
MAAPLFARMPWACIDEVAIVKTIPVDRRHNAKVDYAALLTSLEDHTALARFPASEIADYAQFGEAGLSNHPRSTTSEDGGFRA